MPLNEITSLVSLVFTVISAIVTLALRASMSEAQVRQAKDKEETREWMETRFLSSREADVRLVRIESSHVELKNRVDDNERRLRRVEQRRNRTQPE
jgi:hypothetical protein